jgi:CHASE3 domain sensor protein
MNTIHNMYWSMGQREYLRELQQAPSRIERVCQELRGLMTEEAWKAWLDTTPDDNAGFDAAAEAKLAAELVAWEQEERYADLIAAHRDAFVAQIRERKNPCGFGSAAWFAGIPEEEI